MINNLERKISTVVENTKGSDEPGEVRTACQIYLCQKAIALISFFINSPQQHPRWRNVVRSLATDSPAVERVKDSPESVDRKCN